jgi:hypothetical protein
MKKRISFSAKIVLGLAGGVVTGLFLGERAAFLEWPAKAFVQLLQVTGRAGRSAEMSSAGGDEVQDSGPLVQFPKESGSSGWIRASNPPVNRRKSLFSRVLRFVARHCWIAHFTNKNGLIFALACVELCAALPPVVAPKGQEKGNVSDPARLRHELCDQI